MPDKSFIWQRPRTASTPRGNVDYVDLCEVLYRLEGPDDILLVSVIDKFGTEYIGDLDDEECAEVMEIIYDMEAEND